MGQKTLVVLDFEDSKMFPTSNVWRIENIWINNLWDTLKHAKIDAQSNQKPPFKEIDFDKKTLKLEVRIEYGNLGSAESMEEKKEVTPKTLPSYKGEHKDKFKAYRLPSH